MAAPSAPVIHVLQHGGRIRVRWYEVDNATDYNVYMGSDPNPTGIEDSVADGEQEPNGWFVWWSVYPQIGQVYVRVTALNAMAEESDYSNECYRYMNSDADAQYMDEITHALDMIRRE